MNRRGTLMRGTLIVVGFVVGPDFHTWRAMADVGGEAASVAADGHLTAADYDRAARVLDWTLQGKVRNAVVAPRWISGRDMFWYRRDGDDGPEFVIVDAQTGAKAQAFDTARVAAALSATAGEPSQQPRDLVVTGIDKESELLRVKLAHHRRQYACTVPAYVCTLTTQIETGDGVRVSPDRSRAVFAKGDDLWVRDLKSGDERQLTSDGEPYFSYVKPPDSNNAALPRLRNPAVLAPWWMYWSPDGRTIAGMRFDERAVAAYPFVEWVPQDGSFRPVTYQIRLPLLGDPVTPREPYAIDVTTGTKREIRLPPGLLIRSWPSAWSSDNRRAYGLAISFGQREAALVEVDVETGKVRTVISESSPTNLGFNSFLYDNSNVCILAESGEAVWWSERDGWGHLYLYDIATGELKRRLTQGPWLARNIIRVDEKRRELFFTASGREPGQDPYYRHLYRVSLDGGAPVELTPEDAEHAFDAVAFLGLGGPKDDGQKVSPSGRYVVDTYTTVDQPPVTVLRSAVDGAVVAKLEEADASAVYASGWRAPQRVLVKAADGETDISAVVYFPPDLLTGKRYPVIDAFYGGPLLINAPRSFVEAVSTYNPVSRAALAQLGFIVVTIDARGTPGRSKAFANVGYGNWADPQIADHITAIKQLASRFGNFDLDRVGVYGHSYGGYTSARAILSHPEFYKVAVASAGSHNYQGFYQGLTETYFGLPDYGDGSPLRPNPVAIPDVYRRLDNASLASNLRGKLMLVYGDMDENALPAVTLQLVDALEKANKNFDLLYLPNRTHAFFRGDTYYVRRMWDYFVEHLAATRPPEGYDLNSATLAR
jgi:dipeptidyl-peptidase 4